MGVPMDWTSMIEQHRLALNARAAMQAARCHQDSDVAVIAYTRAVDRMVDHMTRLSETHVLGQLTLHLARVDRFPGGKGAV